MNGEKFTNTSISIKGLLGLIEAKDIAIPEIQRPFVWKNSQVRDLIDSLYKGYPTGYIILWKNPNVKLKDGTSNPQPIGFSGILLAKRQNSFYCTYFLHNRNVADTKSPYPIKRLEVIRWFNQKSMVFNQSLS